MRVVTVKKRMALALSVVLLAAVAIAGFIHLAAGSGTFPASPVYGEEPVYQGSSEKKEIALTCNVFWGEEFLPQMLEILKENDVPMTFFIGGMWAEKFPDLTAEIIREGHEIGNHGYSHPHPDRLSMEENLEDILKSEKVLKDITGGKPVLYAPPYGERGPAVLQAAEKAGYRTILWSIDTVDWKHPKPEAVINKVLKNAHNGAIVLMHPTAPTVYALPDIIESLEKQGYTMVTVSRLLRDKKA